MTGTTYTAAVSMSASADGRFYAFSYRAWRFS
ncbi:MAG: hypothetical protein QOE28_1719 [Solirubrobacteraceae bacterium]|nr:hypothetical protein [Solirubrobacteraceae bacterium]